MLLYQAVAQKTFRVEQTGNLVPLSFRVMGAQLTDTEKINLA